MRILVTGGRDYADYGIVENSILHWAGTDSIVVYGANPKGADRFAQEVVDKFVTLLTPEAHPADWGAPCTLRCHHKLRTRNGKNYCPAQGNLRNTRMVNLGADICLAFPTENSRGTVDCVKKAMRAGIHVVCTHAMDMKKLDGICIACGEEFC